jgi:hypothetical protein
MRMLCASILRGKGNDLETLKVEMTKDAAARRGTLVGVAKVWRGRPVLTSLEIPE